MSDRMPRAYALSLWLRELGVADGEIASALDVAPESVTQLLRLAELKQVRGNGQAAPPAVGGVAVVVDGGSEEIERAADHARDQGTPLHLIAFKRSAPSRTYVDAARHALELTVDVEPVVLSGSRAKAIRSLVDQVGPLTFV